MTPVKRSIFSESFMRRSSLTLASVPAASSAKMVSILRLPRKPPSALISSAASRCPLRPGSPSRLAGPVRNVMWPVLNGVSGTLPLTLRAAFAGRGPATKPAPTRPVPAAVRPSAPKNSSAIDCVWIVHALLLEAGLVASPIAFGRPPDTHRAQSYHANFLRAQLVLKSTSQPRLRPIVLPAMPSRPVGWERWAGFWWHHEPPPLRAAAPVPNI